MNRFFFQYEYRRSPVFRSLLYLIPALKWFMPLKLQLEVVKTFFLLSSKHFEKHIIDYSLQFLTYVYLLLLLNKPGL